MGATLITVRSTGVSMRDAYNNAVEEATYEYGNDNYNGTISTTRGCTDVTKEFVKSGKNLNKWGDALGICVSPPISNNNKIKTKVDTTPQKGTRVWETFYEVKLFDGTIIGGSTFQIDAINMGRKYTEETRSSTYVHITKRLVNSKTLVSTINYKAADKEKVGSYYFIALAAE
jgi:hypothetical protein